MTEARVVQVGIGLIERGGSFLIRQRPATPGSPMPGLWEFPGGKVEPGETPAAATARECREEVGLDVTVGSLNRRLIHEYPHGLVELFYFHAHPTDPRAEPGSKSGFRWVHSADLPAYTFPPANDALIADLARLNSKAATNGTRINHV